MLISQQQREAEAAILRVGTPLRWNQAVPHVGYVRKSGVRQFAYQYSTLKDVKTPAFKWGDEIEYGIFNKDKRSGDYDLSLRADELRKQLTDCEEHKWKQHGPGFDWQPEYGSWMVEIVPEAPFGGYIVDLLDLENSHRERRMRLHTRLKDTEIAPSLSNFPMLGVPGYGHSRNTRGPIAYSKLVDDAVINPHPRMGALTANIRARRDRNVNISMPVAEMFGGGSVDMDAMAFGMGCTCLQVTMQCRDEWESRYLHDQWVVLSPLFLALSASTPFFNGKVVDSDTRWEAISQAVDCRTEAEEFGPWGAKNGLVCHNDQPKNPDSAPKERKGLYKNGVSKVTKSRYSSASLFIGKCGSPEEEARMSALNDIDPNFNCQAYHLLVDSGMDNILAAHVAHLFVRDPLVIFDDAIDSVDDTQDTDHFDNIQSTNWRSVRWKLPAKEISSDPQAPGWRLEMRTLEMQCTDFENAAYIIATVLLSRAMLAKKLNFYMPISKVEDNFTRSAHKGAATGEKFHMRMESLNKASEGWGKDERTQVPPKEDCTTKEMSLDSIFNGDTRTGFKGLLPVIREYLDDLQCDNLTKANLEPYLKLLERRASGELPTTAQWMRNKLVSHPDYRHDGLIPRSAANDFMDLAEDIGMGRKQCPKLVGRENFTHEIKVDKKEGIYMTTELSGAKAGTDAPLRECVMTSEGKKCVDLSVSPSGSGYVPTSTCSKEI
jgi:glutamate--cysteine ligase catalytic subunit